MRMAVWAAVPVLFLVGCGGGDDHAPLVCRLGYCRNECATSEDCGAGQSCVLDLDKLGVCQLPTETHCTLATDCPPSLVCRFEQCVNACETDRDCLGGARCVVDPAGNACLDVGVVPCVFDGDCGFCHKPEKSPSSAGPIFLTEDPQKLDKLPQTTCSGAKQ